MEAENSQKAPKVLVVAKQERITGEADEKSEKEVMLKNQGKNGTRNSSAKNRKIENAEKAGTVDTGARQEENKSQQTTEERKEATPEEKSHAGPMG